MAEHAPDIAVTPGQTDRDSLNARLITALAACEALDELDWCLGYELVGTNQEKLDRALDLARAAIAAAKPPKT